MEGNTVTLRPIGTVFTYDFPPDFQSTDMQAHRATYEIVAHVEAESYFFPGRIVTVEEVRILSMEPINGQ